MHVATTNWPRGRRPRATEHELVASWPHVCIHADVDTRGHVLQTRLSMPRVKQTNVATLRTLQKALVRVLCETPQDTRYEIHRGMRYMGSVSVRVSLTLRDMGPVHVRDKTVGALGVVR